ncbi:MAG: hypothetical protein ABIN94_01835 [Ferruginibacter sp.]
METTNEKAGASKNAQSLSKVINGDVTKKIVIIIIITGLILLATLWIWKSIEIRNIKNDTTTEKKELQQYAIKQVRQSHETHLKLLAKPLVWAIRTEMLSNNISQVNIYSNDLVKEKNFQKITIANDKGIVILSTNKKEEGKEFASVGNLAYLKANDTMIDNINDTLVVMSSPIMGFNSRLGTVIITYAFHPLVFK